MTALPTLDNTPFDPARHPNSISAYRVCLDFQSVVNNDHARLVHARLLGYLLIHTVNDPLALHEVTKVIHSCSSDFDKLSQLGESFINYYIRLFKKNKSRTPAPSEHPSRRSFDSLKNKIKSNIQEAPADLKTAKKRALVRDGFRCVVSGIYDENAILNGISPATVLAAGGIVHTQCAHIIPESTYFGVQDDQERKLDYSASVLAVLKRFGYNIEQINGKNVHSLFNIMTLESNIHEWFDRLELWLEKLPAENSYRVCSTRPERVLRRTEITFTTSDPEYLPVPSEHLLRLHAVCCRVAHLSGAGEYVEQTWRDEEELGVLAEDGGSAMVLRNALLDEMSKLPAVVGA